MNGVVKALSERDLHPGIGKTKYNGDWEPEGVERCQEYEGTMETQLPK